MKNKITKLFILISLIQSSFMKSNNIVKSSMKHNRKASFATIEPGVNHFHLLSEFRICKTDANVKNLKSFMSNLAVKIEMPFLNKDAIISVERHNELDDSSDIEIVAFCNTGSIKFNYWRKPRLLVLEITGFNIEVSNDEVAKFVQSQMGLIEYTDLSIGLESVKTESLKIEVRDDHSLGKGLFAKEDIKKGEFIGGLYGRFYEADNSMDLPEEVRDHLMQCGDKYYRGNEFADEAVQYLNHSCDPNCAVQGLFDFVAMRDIKAGEEITTDYAMQDDSNWEVPGGGCLCGSKNCRNGILPYRDLTQSEKDNYKDYVSHWILHKYKICTCK